MTVALVTLSEFKEIVKGHVTAKLDESLPERIRKKLPVPFVWGPPGCGKTESVYQVGGELGIPVYTVLLTYYDPTEVKGILYIHQDGKGAEVRCTRPHIFPEKGPAILDLGEVPQAELMTRKAATQLILEGRIGEHVLPEDVVLIANGNRMQDRAGTTKMMSHEANRFKHYEIVHDYEGWTRWGLNNGIHPWIIAYHNFTKGTRLNMFDPEKHDRAYPTARSWEFASAELNNPHVSDELKEKNVAACVGEAEALEFYSYIKVKDSLPKVEDIIEGREKKAPKDKSAIYLLSSIMVAELAHSAAQDNGTAEKLERVVKYVGGFDTELQIVFVMDALKVHALKPLFTKSIAYRKWVQENKDVILEQPNNGRAK